jgi:hypothetical protein
MGRKLCYARPETEKGLPAPSANPFLFRPEQSQRTRIASALQLFRFTSVRDGFEKILLASTAV